MQRYEYKLLHFKAGSATASGLPDDLNVQFDELGREGWEYIEMKPIQTGGFFLFFIGVFTNTKRFIVIFRRPVPSSQD
jgi:hypothetical protein